MAVNWMIPGSMTLGFHFMQVQAGKFLTSTSWQLGFHSIQAQAGNLAFIPYKYMLVNGLSFHTSTSWQWGFHSIQVQAGNGAFIPYKYKLVTVMVWGHGNGAWKTPRETSGGSWFTIDPYSFSLFQILFFFFFSYSPPPPLFFFFNVTQHVFIQLQWSGKSTV